MAHSDLGFATFSLEDLALGLLMRGPNHGYHLYQEYERWFQPVWTVGRSKFYSALASLHETGHLDAEIELQDDRPPRKIYHLTALGEERFLQWLYQPVQPTRAIRVEFLAKLRFFLLLQRPDPERLIDAQIHVCAQLLDDWVDAPAGVGDPFDEIVQMFRRHQLQALIDWLEACRIHLASPL